ncbi:MAG: fructose-6-phosphate aldolase [Candidatus Diapherotrites archaeon]|nr:fructose-6-phosphate aldolase [Candidatus Diapherotrites archaeon]
MKIFIDSADMNEIRKANAMGLLDGVTTNPSLAAKAGRKDFEQLLKEICREVNGPVSAEVVSTDTPGMLAEAEKLVKIHSNIVIKIPLTEEGLNAVKTLSGKGIKTNVTLCFSPTQALLAAKAGATYISPFVGRLDDIAQDGMSLVSEIITIYRNYGYKTQVLVASVRSPMHVVKAALMGADVVTIPFSVIPQLVSHPLTDKGLARFLEDWKKLQGK